MAGNSPIYIGAAAAGRSDTAALQIIDGAADITKKLQTVEEWASKDDGVYVWDFVNNATTNEYSAWEYAIGTTVPAGSSKEWATTVNSAVSGTDFSAKEHAHGTANSGVLATGGSAKEWAMAGGVVQGSGDNDLRSAKAWAQDGLTGATQGGSSKDWAQTTGGTVNGSEWSAKAYATEVGTNAPTDGSAKEWAKTTGEVVADSEYSAKEWATGTTPTAGTAKQWALGGGASHTENVAVEGSNFSARNYATTAQTYYNSTVSKYDEFDDRFLGDKVSGARELTDTTPTPSGAWEASQTHTNVYPTSTSGSGVISGNGGAKFDITTDGSGNPTIGTINWWGSNFAVGDTMVLTDPGSTSNTATITVSKIHPLKDNDGLNPNDGTIYFNTDTNQMYAYAETGTTWHAFRPSPTDQVQIDTLTLGKDGTTSTSGTNLNIRQVDVVADNVANVNTVAGISANVTTVAGISSDVTAVAGDATDIGAVAAKATEIGRLGTADAVADMALLGTTDCVADMALLGTSDCVADMALLGTTDCIADMNTLAVSDVIADMNTLGTADVVSDLNTLGTADVVSDMNTLGTGGNVTNMNTLAGISGNITTVAGISGNVTTVAGISANVTTVATNNADVTTVATNISSVTDFASKYRVASSAPSSDNDEGDLYYNSTTDSLSFYDGSAWQGFGLTLAQTQAEASNAAVAMSIALG